MTSWSVALALMASLRTLVLPFESVSESTTLDWRGSGFEEALSVHLESAGHDVVGLRERNLRLQEKGFTPGVVGTRASAILLAQELGADRLVVGSFVASEQRLEVTARLIDLDRGATTGVVEDYASPAAFAELASRVAKNVLRLEADTVPEVFETEAERRRQLPSPALEASALARLSLSLEEQRQLLEAALALEPDYLEARLLLGSVLLDMGEPREAIEVLAAKTSGVTHRNAYFKLGLAYLAVDRPLDALEIYLNLAGLDEKASYYNNLGVALLRVGRRLEATEAFEKALDLSPYNHIYVFNLGWSYWRTGKGRQAFEMFDRAVLQSPVDADAYLMLAAAAASQARTEEAERARQTALILAPHLEEVDPATVVGLERPSLYEAESAIASAVVPVMLEGADENFILAELLSAWDYRKWDQLETGVRALQSALYREPAATALRRELACFLRDTGRLQQAAAEFAIVLWDEPNADVHVELADVYLELAEVDKAVEQVTLALELEPGHAAALALSRELATEP